MFSSPNSMPPVVLSGGAQLGGAYQDEAGAIGVRPDGSVYTTGGFYGTADFDPGAST